LEFGGDGANIVGATQETCKRRLVVAIFGLVSASKRVLHALEEIDRNERGVFTVVGNSSPHELPDIETVFENCFQIGAVDPQGVLIEDRFVQGGERMPATGVQLEHAPQNR